MPKEFLPESVHTQRHMPNPDTALAPYSVRQSKLPELVLEQVAQAAEFALAGPALVDRQLQLVRHGKLLSSIQLLPRLV